MATCSTKDRGSMMKTWNEFAENAEKQLEEAYRESWHYRMALMSIARGTVEGDVKAFAQRALATAKDGGV
jgi:hypothetical protein